MDHMVDDNGGDSLHACFWLLARMTHLSCVHGSFCHWSLDSDTLGTSRQARDSLNDI